MKQETNVILGIFVVALLLNVVWEFAQMPLYTPAMPFAEHAPMCLRASLFDAAYAVVLYLLVARMRGVFLWVRSWTLRETFGIALVSFAVATFIELHALARGRWGYTDSMPLVPGVHVGLTPFLQLTALSLATFFLLRVLVVGWFSRDTRATMFSDQFPQRG